MIATSSSEGSSAEAERQLGASALRHREVTGLEPDLVREGLDRAVPEEQSLPAPTDLDDLHDGLEAAWRSWRDGLQRQET
jgi:hypothetical protein